MKIYVIGSLRNPKIPEVGAVLRGFGHEVFDDWYAAGPEADDYWAAYERGRGKDMRTALKTWAAQNTLAFDRKHLERADAVVLVMPAGKSGHLELGYAIGKGAKGFVLLDGEPERWDCMYGFAENVAYTIDQLVEDINAVAK